MRSKFRFALALSAALSTAPAFTGKALAAPDQTLGMAIMSAFVDVDGSLGYGSGVVSSAYNSVGKFYTVSFNRPLAGCVSNVSSSSGARIASSGFAVDNSVRVETYGVNGVIGAGAFNLIVFCAR